MTKKIIALADYVNASDAAMILSKNSGYQIDPGYVRKLAKSKKQPIRTQQVGNRLLYLKTDLERTKVKQKKHNTTS